MSPRSCAKEVIVVVVEIFCLLDFCIFPGRRHLSQYVRGTRPSPPNHLSHMDGSMHSKFSSIRIQYSVVALYCAWTYLTPQYLNRLLGSVGRNHRRRDSECLLYQVSSKPLALLSLTASSTAPFRIVCSWSHVIARGPDTTFNVRSPRTSTPHRWGARLPTSRFRNGLMLVLKTPPITRAFELSKSC